ncbi:hypothetical protein [Archangium sp.]|uniref:hypothetical protein n=1 Tax=Archangium sp. TaxID=1872627 RepID=UPI00286B9DF2|nr:hypothetical protein [Archangium sp.]
MKVLVIPEDPTLDKYILKPIVERLFKDVGRKAQIEVLEDPHLRGIDEALDSKCVAQIVAENPMVDLFLLMVDRDCNRYRNEERAEAREQEHPGKLLACLAVQEVEVWMVALHREAVDAPSWKEVRAECDPKERYADPLLRELSSPTAVGHGRKQAMREIATQWNALVQRCEELARLRERLQEWVASHAG